MKTKMFGLAKGIVGVALCAGSLCGYAAEKEQVAYGIKWTYLVGNGKAIITDNSTWVRYPESPVAIKIPAKLGGCPVEKLRKSMLHNLASPKAIDCDVKLLGANGKSCFTRVPRGAKRK